jgi:predicted MPP superfamily phosphohydrolase
MRATWATDLHLNFLKPPARRVFLDRVREERPHVLLVSGDTGEGNNVFDLLNEMVQHVGVPVYYVLGNHDFYRSDIQFVRDVATDYTKREVVPSARWLQVLGPVKLTDHVVLVGVDGWADGRTGNPHNNECRLADWSLIQDLRHQSGKERLRLVQALADRDAALLREHLGKVEAAVSQVIVVTHVPPFPQACWYAGKMSDNNWRPWFTCVATGKVLADYAADHPEKKLLVLCGHTHGEGVYQHSKNLEVKTGGWPVGVKDYGNPVIQTTFELD